MNIAKYIVKTGPNTVKVTKDLDVMKKRLVQHYVDHHMLNVDINDWRVVTAYIVIDSSNKDEIDALCNAIADSFKTGTFMFYFTPNCASIKFGKYKMPLIYSPNRFVDKAECELLVKTMRDISIKYANEVLASEKSV